MTKSDSEELTPTYLRSGMVPGGDVAAFLRSWDGVAATLIDRHLNVSGSSRLVRPENRLRL